MKRLIVLALSVLLLGMTGLSVEPANAARGSISVPDGVYGGTTTARVNPGGDAIWVYAECFQDDVLVYAQYVETDANNQAVLSLGPTPSWTGGPASCTAEEGYFNRSGRWHTVADTTFEVSG